MEFLWNYNTIEILTNCCSVGSNAVSAFLSWRLQATTSCDVTLVWKANYEAVAQYGVSFKYVGGVLCNRLLLLSFLGLVV